MSQRVTKLTKWPVHSVKTQISLCIPVWSVFAVRLVDSQGPKAFSCGQCRPRLGRCTGWSDSSRNAQLILLFLSRAEKLDPRIHFKSVETNATSTFKPRIMVLYMYRNRGHPYTMYLSLEQRPIPQTIRNAGFLNTFWRREFIVWTLVSATCPLHR